MPPPLRLLAPRRCLFSTPSTTPITPFLLPFLQQSQQHRSASILSSLSDNPGAYHKKKRLGRGPASGKGKTAGRGQKGQKAHGKVPAGFNGGQTKLEITQGPRGFLNHFSVDMSPLNIDRLQSWIDQGRLDPSKPITMKELNDSRCLHGVKDGVKLLARGSEQMRTPVNIVVSRASATAIAAIEAAGGTVTTRYYSPTSIPRVLKGLTHPFLSLQSPEFQQQIQTASSSSTSLASEPVSATESVSTIVPAEILTHKYRLPDATSRRDIEYYRDPAHRGYLSYLVKEGEGPSLFFKVPGQNKGAKKNTNKTQKAAATAANRLW